MLCLCMAFPTKGSYIPILQQHQGTSRNPKFSHVWPDPTSNSFEMTGNCHLERFYLRREWQKRVLDFQKYYRLATVSEGSPKNPWLDFVEWTWQTKATLLLFANVLLLSTTHAMSDVNHELWNDDQNLLTYHNVSHIFNHLRSCINLRIWLCPPSLNDSMKSPIGPTEPWFPHDQIHPPLHLHRWLRSTNLL